MNRTTLVITTAILSSFATLLLVAALGCLALWRWERLRAEQERFAAQECLRVRAAQARDAGAP